MDALKETTFMTEIQKAYDEEISIVKSKLAEMMLRLYNSEMKIAISITQIYNSGFSYAFTQAQPEIGLFCFIITQFYPKETKAGLRNAISSVASIGYNSAKSGFGKIFGFSGSKPPNSEPIQTTNTSGQ